MVRAGIISADEFEELLYTVAVHADVDPAIPFPPQNCWNCHYAAIEAGRLRPR